ncbi:hypothetical protein K438DRAFT_1987739 [Mycena galopus ATCC 62051]|nr:hypothetical protein K438DRAFT_1987739 [Mycena galopus ATCC 62051]
MSIADAPKLDDPKSPVSDGVRAPQLKLDDHDASLPLAGCALLEHDAGASSALKRELHHNNSRAVAARSSKHATKRAKLTLSQGQRSRRLRIAYTSLRQLHRPRHQRIVSVCRGGLDPIDILAPLLAGMSLQPTCSDAIQVDILGAGLAALSLPPTGSNEVDCNVLDAGLAALSLQPTGSDAMECESLAFALTALSLASKKRNRDEFEEDAAAIDVDARPYKRVRFTAAPRPGRVPHSSWIAARRRLLFIWSRIAWSRVAVPLPAAVAVPPNVVAIPIISPTPDVVVSAPTVFQNCTNTFVSGTGPNANDIKVGRKSESRSGGAGSVKRTKKTPSARENAAPFPVSCKAQAHLARDSDLSLFSFLFHGPMPSAGSVSILFLFLYMWGPMPPLLDSSPPSSSSIDCFHLFFSKIGPMSLENAALDDNLLARTGARPGADDLPDIYCLTWTLARLELTHASTHCLYRCFRYGSCSLQSLSASLPSPPGAPPSPWTIPTCSPSGDPRRSVATGLLDMDLPCTLRFLHLDHPSAHPSSSPRRGATDPAATLPRQHSAHATLLGDLAAPVFTQHYSSILHCAGLRVQSVTIVSSCASLLGVDTHSNYDSTP